MLLTKNKDGKTVLELRAESSRHENFQALIIRVCTDNESRETFQIWIEAVKFFSIEFIQELEEAVDLNMKFPDSFYKNLLTFRDDRNQKILKCAQERKENPEIFLFFMTKKQKILNYTKIREIRSINN